MENVRMCRSRSLSEPSLQVTCSNFLGDRSRRSNLVYEKGRDKIAHWIGSWGYEEMCAVLYQLVTRSNYSQMGYLWTALSSIPHRDFIYSATIAESSFFESEQGKECSELGGIFFPLSTPISRDKNYVIKKSRKAENIRLHRLHSVADVCDGLFPTTATEAGTSSQEEHCSSHIIFRPNTGEWDYSSRLSSLPISQSKPADTRVPLRPSLHWSYGQPSASQPSASQSVSFCRSQLPSLPATSSLLLSRGRPVTSSMQQQQFQGSLSRPKTQTSYSTTPKLVPHRTLRPLKRHMTTPIPGRPLITPVTPQLSPPIRQVALPESVQMFPLPLEGLECAVWFSNLKADWQQKEILELVISNLDYKELYYLSILLMSRQYRDIVSKLPEALATRVLSYVPAKVLLSQCCQVCHMWNRRCSSPALWEIKAMQNRLTLPIKSFTSWKQYFIDDLKLKKNWVKGNCITSNLTGHTKRVQAVCLKDEHLVSGSSDCTVRVWSLVSHECISVLEGHSKAVWCVQFYGKNMVISGAGDGLIKIWNYRSSTCERTLEFHSGTVWAIQLKGELLVSGANDKLVCMWDVRKCQRVRSLEGHKGVVFTVDLSDDTKLIYSGAGDHTVKEWCALSGVCLRSIKISRLESVISICWDKDYLAVSCGKLIELWNTHTWNKVSSFRGHGDRVEAVQLKVHDASKPTGTLLSGSKDQTVKYWDITRNKSVRTLSVGSLVASCYSNSVYVACATTKNQVRVYDFHPHHTTTASAVKAGTSSRQAHVFNSTPTDIKPRSS